MPERYLTWNQVRPLVGNLCRTTVWRMTREGRFPKSIAISERRCAWRESDIMAWQTERAAAVSAE